MQEHNFQETAWLVGVDHAKFNLRRDASAPQAFLAGYDSWTGRKKKADVFVRKWLYLRLSAIKRQRILTSDITPQFLREIVSPICPVSLSPLTTGKDGKTNWSVDILEAFSLKHAGQGLRHGLLASLVETIVRSD